MCPPPGRRPQSWTRGSGCLALAHRLSILFGFFSFFKLSPAIQRRNQKLEPKRISLSSSRSSRVVFIPRLETLMLEANGKKSIVALSHSISILSTMTKGEW